MRQLCSNAWRAVALALPWCKMPLSMSLAAYGAAMDLDRKQRSLVNYQYPDRASVRLTS